MLLAVDWQGEPLLGWLASEKLNGCRVEWDGEVFWTRNGNIVDAPKWFTRGLPKCRINGEIHAGRGFGFGNDNSAYKVAMTAVRHGGDWFNECDDCNPIRFTALYLPEAEGNWHTRQIATARAVKGCANADAINCLHLTKTGDMANMLANIRNAGGEGAMFVNPRGGSEYGRTGDLLRFKFSRECHISSESNPLRLLK